MTCLGLWRRGQSAIDFIILPEFINADNAWGIRTFHFRIVVQSFPIGLEIVRQIIERKFFRPGCSRLPDDGRKSFREKRSGKQCPGKHHPAHRILHTAFPEDRLVSVYEISHSSFCHLGLLTGGLYPRNSAKIRINF